LATLTDSVLELDDAVLEFSQGVVERSITSISQVEDTADTAYRKVANLERLVGSSHEMGGSEFDHPTLWGCCTWLGDKYSGIITSLVIPKLGFMLPNQAKISLCSFIPLSGLHIESKKKA
jgi:hypothetical protein